MSTKSIPTKTNVMSSFRNVFLPTFDADHVSRGKQRVGAGKDTEVEDAFDEDVFD